MHNYRLPAIILVVVLEAHQQPLLNELTVELLSLAPKRVITMANNPSVSISIRDLLISFPISRDNTMTFFLLFSLTWWICSQILDIVFLCLFRSWSCNEILVTIVVDNILLELLCLWWFDDFLLLQILTKEAIELFNCGIYILLLIDVRVDSWVLLQVL